LVEKAMFGRKQRGEAPTSFQTIRLGKGRHFSARGEVCVMELASMLAGEKFTDQPRSVCPVIASFLRAYNDAIDDHRRQDLYGFAAKAVGSRASEAIHRARAERLAAWTSAYVQPQQSRFFRFCRRGEKLPRRIEHIGPYVVAEIPKHTDETHARVLALVDELLAIVDPGSAAEPRVTPAAFREGCEVPA
jgi:hypothetical protein